MSEKTVTVDRGLLVAMLNAALVVDGKSRMPILNTVQLAAGSGTLKVGAFTYNSYVALTLPAQSDSRWKICVSPKMVMDVVSAMRSESVDLAVDLKTQVLEVRTARGEATFRGLSADDFPARVDPGKLSRRRDVAADTFMAAIAGVSAAEKEGFRAWMNNVVDSDVAFSTDGKRAAIVDMSLLDEDYGVPAAVAGLLPRLLDLANAASVGVRKSETTLRLTTSDAEIDIHLPEVFGHEGMHDLLQKYVQSESTAVVVAGRKQLAGFLQAQTNFGHPMARLTVEKNKLTLTPVGKDRFVLGGEEVASTMDVDGGPLDCVVTVKLLRETLTHIDTELVEIHDVATADAPLKISAAGGGGTQHVIAKVRLPEEKKEEPAHAV